MVTTNERSFMVASIRAVARICAPTPTTAQGQNTHGSGGIDKPVTGLSMPPLPWVFWPWAVVGVGAQILATALMLATMNDRSFVVTIAYIKTEPIQAAIFGLIFLGDPLTIGMIVAILVATAG